MSATVLRTRTAAPLFPEAQIRSEIERWWAERIAERASDPFARKDPETLYEILPAIDSLTIMDGLIVIERVVGFEVPVKFVKRGGYSTPEEMISHLINPLRKYYEKLHSS